MLTTLWATRNIVSNSAYWKGSRCFFSPKYCWVCLRDRQRDNMPAERIVRLQRVAGISVWFLKESGLILKRERCEKGEREGKGKGRDWGERRKKMELQGEDPVWKGCYLNVALVSKLLEGTHDWLENVKRSLSLLIGLLITGQAAFSQACITVFLRFCSKYF